MPITLNIGGTKFVTTCDTLISSGDNYFNYLLSEYTNKNEFFIDRDPDMFPYILSFLRGYSLVMTTGPLSEKQNRLKLLEDARFYQIQPLVATLEKVLHQHPSASPNAPLTSLWKILQELKEEWCTLTNQVDSALEPKYPTGYQADLTEGSPFNQIQSQITLFREAIAEHHLYRKTVITKHLLALLGPLLEKWSPESPYTNNLTTDFSQFLETEEDLIRRVVQHHSDHCEDVHPYLALLIAILTFMATRALFNFRAPPDQTGSEQLKDLADSLLRQGGEESSELFEMLVEQFQLV